MSELVEKTAIENGDLPKQKELFSDKEINSNKILEIDYDDIDEKSYSKKANTGYLAIGDKYWVTSIIPANGRAFLLTISFLA